MIQTETAGLDADIQREYGRQREHLEKSVASLRKKLNKDSEIHHADNVRVMQVMSSLSVLFYLYFLICIVFCRRICLQSCYMV